MLQKFKLLLRSCLGKSIKISKKGHIFFHMNNPTVVLANGGEVKLPVGFRFRPTDEELLVHYLNRKVLSVPLPAVVIPELDVFRTNPWSLPGDLSERRHFFSKRPEILRSSNLQRKRRRAAGAIRDGSSGHWKFTGKEKRIVAYGNNRVIGTKRKLVFCEGKLGIDSTKPQYYWIMHELCLHKTRTNKNMINPPGILEKEEEEWAVYRVFQKRRKLHSKSTNNPTVIDFRNETDYLTGLGSGSAPPPPPSPCSSSSNHE